MPSCGPINNKLKLSKNMLLVFLILWIYFLCLFTAESSAKPIAFNQFIETSANSTKGIILNGTDKLNSSLNYQITVFPINGIIYGDPPNLQYAPNYNFSNGYDFLIFRVINSNNVTSADAVVLIKVSSEYPDLLFRYGPAIITMIILFAILFAILLHFNDKMVNSSDENWIDSHGKKNSEILVVYIDKLEKKFNSYTGNSEILSNEYKRYHDLLMNYGSLGERRINFFITFITAIIGSLGVASVVTDQNIITNIENNKALFIVILFLLLSLFLFGLLTFRRIINGNVTTDDHKINLDIIRLMYRFLPLNYVKSRRNNYLMENITLQRGGIVQIVKMMSSLIIGLINAFIWISYFGQLDYLVIIPFLIGIIGSWINISIYGNLSTIRDEKGRIRVI